MNLIILRKSVLVALLLSCVGGVLLMGCRATPVGAVVNVVGKGVDDADVRKRRDKFINKPVGDMTRAFGRPVDIYADLNSDREIWVYRDPGDLLKKARFVAEVRGNKIKEITKARPYEDYAIAVPMRKDMEKKCLGKSPAECQKIIDKGKPVAVLQNTLTGNIVELYDIRVNKSLQNPHYAVLTYNNSDKCIRIRLAESTASTKKGTL